VYNSVSPGLGSGTEFKNGVRNQQINKKYNSWNLVLPSCFFDLQNSGQLKASLLMCLDDLGLQLSQ
jgi:hypothetical protein